jgi:hypothetical protein
MVQQRRNGDPVERHTRDQAVFPPLILGEEKGTISLSIFSPV